MKLLTQAGLLYNTVSSQTVDGHYGTFPELDWIASWDEAVRTTTTPLQTTIGISPMVTGMRTTYDGGKVMSGFGMFTGTSTAAWVLMTFGTKNCTGTVGPTEPTGYATMATYGGTTTVLCATKASWIWSPPTLTTSMARSSIVMDVAESWPVGTQIVTPHTAIG